MTYRRFPCPLESKLYMFADDMLLYKPVASADDFTKLQDDINAINQWIVDNHLHSIQPKLNLCSYLTVQIPKLVQL